MSRNLRTLTAVLVAATIVLVTFVIGRYQQVQADQLSKSLDVTNSQIGRFRARIASMSAIGEPTLQTQLLWTGNTIGTPEQAMQAWALGALQRHQQDIRQYVQEPPLASISHPTISLRLEFSGSLKGLIAFLTEAEQLRPAIAVGYLRVRTLSQREQENGKTNVATQLTLWGLFDESP